MSRKTKQRALMVVQWEGLDEHPSDATVLEVSAIPEDITIVVMLDGELEGLMTFGHLQDAVFQAIGDPT